MSELDPVHDALERLEWKDAKRGDETPQSKQRAFTRRTALTGAAAGLVAGMLETAVAASPASAATGGSIFGVSGSYHFVFVNHVTTNPFFTPTQNGISDACKLLGCSAAWTGSETSNVPQMVDAVNTAVTAKADGIAVALIDLHAFNAPVAKALSAGIPVLSYNADAPTNGRLAYIGQDLMVAGEQMGAHILSLLPGGGTVALFIATPGSANIQPRIDGAEAALKGSKVKFTVTATGAAVPAELSAINSFWTSHTTYKGMFAVDGGSTQSVGQVIQKYNLKGKVVGGGFDLTPITQARLAAGDLAFTIDQQPYLQGFLPIIELYLIKASQGLTGAADVDTGLKFITQSTVGPYNNTKTRYEGTSTAPVVAKA
jgi:simple sugar transport system substrate-binding protein